jgi:hypothetical protein
LPAAISYGSKIERTQIGTDLKANRAFSEPGAAQLLGIYSLCLPILNGSTFAQSPREFVLMRLMMQIAKFAIKKRQVKIWASNHDNNGQAKSAHIDWPILTFWLTYFGMMFAILCGLISAGM